MTDFAGSKASDTMTAFADFLIAEVYDGKLPKGVDEASFREGVRLGGSTRGYFQKSESWKSDPRNYLANVEARKAERATEAANKAVETARKATERANAAKAKAEAILAALAAKDAPEVAEDAEDAEDAA
jgi:hypothetical protein